MRKILSFALFTAVLLILAGAQTAFAQEVPKIEIGAHYTMLRFSDFDTNDSGVGARVTFNLTDNLAIDGEYNFFPTKRRHFVDGFYLDSRRYQGLLGVKAGVRGDKVGVFGKLRPGFVHFGEGTLDPTILTILPVPGTFKSTQFALDAGGVFELYPSRSTVLRFDVGDTIIRFNEDGGRPKFTSHNLQISLGAGLRF